MRLPARSRTYSTRSTRLLLVAAGVVFAVVPAACSSSDNAASTSSTTATTTGPTTSAKANANATSTSGTTKESTSTSSTAKSSTTTSSSSTTTTSKSTTTSGPTTTQKGPVVDTGMKCSVFVTLQSADQDRIVAKIAFDEKRNPVPDGPTIVVACQSHPAESVEAAISCYASWKIPNRFCTVGTAIS